ncbi:ATPase, T2SS/T4P/T4SS family [Bacillus mobilis]|uniref:ATPase, T2SS/T4P/T4SS family n=1 Tax=Bacillus mobilis TaxID=2026190 RepID=UPI002E1E5C2D|nr:ATPase, T2SS/T4P/T4SS family [Bacillus mobilis]
MKEQTKVMRLDAKEQRLIELLRKEGVEPLTSLLDMVLNNEGTYDNERMKNEEYVKTLRIGKWIRSLLKDEKFLLEDFESCGYLSSVQIKEIKIAMQQNKNIVITGSTGVGKTTLLNSLLKYQLEKFPERKLVIMEHCPEISPNIDCDNEKILVRDDGDFSMKSLRFLQDSNEPSRLIIGELMTDEEFLSLTSGLQGGCAILATSAGRDFGLRTLNRLMSIPNTKKQIEMLYGTSFLLVHVSNAPLGQKVIDIKEECIQHG